MVSWTMAADLVDFPGWVVRAAAAQEVAVQEQAALGLAAGQEPAVALPPAPHSRAMECSAEALAVARAVHLNPQSLGR